MVGRHSLRLCLFALVLTACNDNGLRGLGPDIAASPNALGFTASAFVGGAPSASMTVIISNEGGGALKISDISITQPGSEFSWQFAGGSTLPLDLSAGSWIATQVVFTPADSTADNAVLVIRSNDADEDPLEIPITTEALGPQLSCTPNPVTFVQAPGQPTTRTVACSNVGNQPLTVTGFTFAPATSSEFTSAFTATPVTIDPGDPLAPFTITYTPSALGPDTGAVLIANNGGEYTLQLTGEGTDQPLCDLSAFPFFVDFGTQILGTTTNKTVLLSNNGNGQCNITSITINALTQEFMYAGAQTYTINPGGSQLVTVSYKPIDRWPDFGALSIQSNDPAEPDLGVLLTGNGKGPEVDVLPCPVDFGLVTVGCKVDRTVTIYNTGDANLTLTASLGAGTNEFSIVTPPATTVAPNQSTTATLRLAATSAGAKSRMLTFATNDFDEPMFQCELKGTGTTNDHQTDTFTQPTSPMADILFVVDNSGSMGDEQQSLATSFQGFANYLVSQNASYHVGVTTTDLGTDPLSAGAAGKLVGNPKIIENSTPNGAQKFAQNANVGTNGDATEQGLEGGRLALTAPLINTDNAGFLRQQAKLFIVFVSDEEDQSPDGNAGQPVSYYVNAFKNIKGVNNPQLLSANAIAGDVPNGCASAQAGQRYYDVVTAIGSGVFSTICTSDFSPALNAIGVEATQPLTEFFLTRVPIPATIVVKVNNVVVSGWSYNAAGNSIVFATAPPLGSTIVVDYDVVCEMP